MAVQLDTHFGEAELIYLLTTEYKYGFSNTDIIRELYLRGFPVYDDVRTKEHAENFGIKKKLDIPTVIV